MPTAQKAKLWLQVCSKVWAYCRIPGKAEGDKPQSLAHLVFLSEGI